MRSGSLESAQAMHESDALALASPSLRDVTSQVTDEAGVNVDQPGVVATHSSGVLSVASQSLRGVANPDVDEEVPDTGEEARVPSLDLVTDALWASLTPDEGKQLSRMLQAASMLQQQIAANGLAVTDLQHEVEALERSCRLCERRAAVEWEGASAAAQQTSRAQREASTWAQKQGLCRTPAALTPSSIVALKQELVQTEGQRERLQRECEKHDVWLESLREVYDLRARSRADLGEMEASMQLQGKQVVRLQQEEALRVVAELEDQAAHQDIVHEGRAMELHTLVDGAVGRRDALLRELAAVKGDLADKQQESTALLQELAEARRDAEWQEEQVRGAVCRVEASPLRELLELAEELDESDEAEIEDDIRRVQAECRQLQHECAAAHRALDRKQAEAERWQSWSPPAAEVPTTREAEADPSHVTSDCAPFWLD